MNTDRAITAILTGSLLVVLALGLWLVWDAHTDVPPPPPPTVPPPPAATASAPPTAAGPSTTPPKAAIGHRLAGTVVGDVRYAIIENPDGSNALYRPGQIVPGLGELLDITEDSVTLDGDDGSFLLRISAAPTTTPTLRLPTTTAADDEPTPEVRRRRDRSESESSP